MKPKILGDFTEKEIECADIIRKNVAHMLKNSLERLKFQHENNLILNFVNESPVGMVVMDSELKVKQYNQISVKFVNEILGNDGDVHFNKNLVKILTDKLYFKGVTCSTSLQANIQNFCIKIVPFAVPDFIQGIKTFYAAYIFKTDNSTSYDSLKTIYKLTNREYEIVCLISQGFSNKKMAGELYLSEHTIKTHIQNIFMKMNCISRTEVLHKLNSKGSL